MHSPGGAECAEARLHLHAVSGKRAAMGKVAFLFPGQGAQKVGMGKAAYDELEVCGSLFGRADRVLDQKLSTLCFEGPEADLRLTANTQPAIFTVSIALHAALERECDAVAGHSLGEYSADVAAGALSFDEALRLLRARGQYMQQAVPVGEGAMMAVLGLEAEQVEQVCASTPGIVEPVNFNCPGQVVIAGAAKAVEAAAQALRERKGKLRPLPVSAPFHSSLMKPAEDKLRPHLEAAEVQNPKVPVYVNVDGRAVSEGGALRDALIRQVSRPVRWEQSLRRMLEDGIELFVEIGPGKALTGMVGRLSKDVRRISVEQPGDLAPAREAIDALRA